MWDDFNKTLTDLRDKGRLRQLRSRDLTGTMMTDVDGTKLVNFGSNDYLGLARFLAERLDPFTSVGATASGLVCGWTQQHQRLAERLAAFEQTQAAVIFPSGYAACSGTVATLCRSGDLILSDALNHASLIDGCRLSKAECVVYGHRDFDAVKQHLEARRAEFKRVWIVTDGVFSMDGHVAPLNQLCDLADQFDANLIVDEAHGTGVLGESGAGVCEALGVKERVPIRIGTLSKALGSQGGFVAGPQVVADYLVNHCRPLIFSTGLAIPSVQAAVVALDSLPEIRQRKQRVCSLSQKVRSALGMNGSPIESTVPIVPVLIGSDSDAVRASERMRKLGLFVPAIRPPTVPQGGARLRVSLSADHTDVMIDRLITSLATL